METIKLSEMSKAKQAKALEQRRQLKYFPTPDMKVYAYGTLVFNSKNMGKYLVKPETKIVEFE